MKKEMIGLYKAIYGDEVRVPIYTFGKGKNVLYIQGGVHGGEVTYFILHELVNYLKSIEEKLDGTVTVVPICNPVSWSQRVYYYTAGKFDLYKGKDWNRSYPGSETTLSSRMSKKIFEIASKHECVIDLHTARNSKPYTIFMSDKSRQIVEVLGIRYNYFIDSKNKDNSVFHGTLNHAVASQGILETTIECGSHDDFDIESVKMVFEALKKLVHLKCLEEKNVDVEATMYVFDKTTTVFSQVSGFAKYNVMPQTKVKNGDEIMQIIPSDDITQSVSIISPMDGVLFELPKTHIVWEGDELFKIIPSESIKILE